ncbi:MAG: hypothetical protein LBR84_00930 [Tannerella sp.]|jgi:hypothetical protein|nr:hypothetical protein [Tannerella sp.]
MKKILLVSFMFMFALMISAQDRPRGGGRFGGDPAARLEQLKKDLGLNEKQVESIKTIDENFMKKMQAQREQGQDGDREARMQQMRKMSEERNAEYKKILTEEQYKKFIEQEEQRRQQFGGPRNGGGDR